ncbi:hypothetical protein M0811_07998 [Anaeramoeba ignava]|uniref:Uncharacterized protein n=1 Tax=Anaeramoeba ignava TaxID=1746090 RepID=A0A9Q0LKU4_ANAIG|nr:hypothetical protein M0811_07998 [Anaeramoeba ignava]
MEEKFLESLIRMDMDIENEAIEEMRKEIHFVLNEKKNPLFDFFETLSTESTLSTLSTEKSTESTEISSQSNEISNEISNQISSQSNESNEISSDLNLIDETNENQQEIKKRRKGKKGSPKIGYKIDKIASLYPQYFEGWNSTTYRNFRNNNIIPDRVVIKDEAIFILAKLDPPNRNKSNPQWKNTRKSVTRILQDMNLKNEASRYKRTAIVRVKKEN